MQIRTDFNWCRSEQDLNGAHNRLEPNFKTVYATAEIPVMENLNNDWDSVAID